MSIKTKLQDIHEKALFGAREALIKMGFSSNAEGYWEGPLEVESFGSVGVKIRFLDDFPDSLPEVSVVDPTQFPHWLPHVELDGKVCLGNAEGLFIDGSRPGSVVVWVLEEAQKRIQDGLNKNNEEDFAQEFLAYWNDNIKWLSILDVEGPPRKITFLKAQKKKILPGKRTYLVAGNLNEAKTWTQNLSTNFKNSFDSFYLPLESPLYSALPKFLKVNEILKIFQEKSSQENFEAFINFISKSKLPILIVLSFPLGKGKSRVLFGIVFEKPSTKELKRLSASGFRPNKITASHQLKFLGNEIVTKVKFDRFDPAYLLGRGGGIMELRDKKVLVVGCGSVGSKIAEKLASAGIGRFLFIDHDNFENDNLQRHILPIKYIGKKKAEALAGFLFERFPHFNFEFRNEKIRSILEKEDEILEGVDLAVIATGDETLEKRLNELFWGSIPCVFAWVEPLGLGGHVLSAGLAGKPGCLECLYRESEGIFSNGASLTAPNQKFRKTHAGCGGTFLPFSALDADRTAIEAVFLAVRILLGKEQGNTLISWFGDPSAFLKEGYRLSKLGRTFMPWERKVAHGHINNSCPVCSGKNQ